MKNNSTKNRNKLQLQTVSFLLIVLPSFGLYFAVTAGIVPAVWLLMMLIVIAMILAPAIS